MGTERENNGMELFMLCRDLIKDNRVRNAAPCAMRVIEEAVERYRRDREAKDKVPS